MNLQEIQNSLSYRQLKEKLTDIQKPKTRLRDKLPLWALAVPKNPYAEEHMLALHKLTPLLSESDIDRVLQNAKKVTSNPANYFNFVRGQILDGRAIEDILGDSG